jgi:hypothetical protein
MTHEDKLKCSGNILIDYSIVRHENNAIKYYIVLNCKQVLHREDGPAIEWLDGKKEWWYYGNLHRDDGPAIEYANGYKSWYKHGEFQAFKGNHQ